MIGFTIGTVYEIIRWFYENDWSGLLNYHEYLAFDWYEYGNEESEQSV